MSTKDPLQDAAAIAAKATQEAQRVAATRVALEERRGRVSRGIAVLDQAIADAQSEHGRLTSLVLDAETVGQHAAVLLAVPADAPARIASLAQSLPRTEKERDRLRAELTALDQQIVGLREQESDALRRAKRAPIAALEAERAQILAQVKVARAAFTEAVMTAVSWNYHRKCNERLPQERPVQPILWPEVEPQGNLLKTLLSTTTRLQHLEQTVLDGMGADRADA